MLFFSFLINLIAFTLAISIQIPFSPPDDHHLAPLYSFGDNIHDAYIVVFKPDTSETQVTNHINWISTFFHNQSYNGYDDKGIHHTYSIGTFKGYSGHFDDRILGAIRKSDQIAYVEQDSYVHTTALQNSAPWGLARISHRKRLSRYNQDKYYFHAELAGKDIRVYIIDTGIYVDHDEFEGRAVWGTTVPRFEQDVDGNGHGTHCAGIVAGSTFGVAKKASLVAVKVMRSDGSGTMSDVLMGVDWTLRNYLEDQYSSRNTRLKGAVANMSLGGRKSPALESAVDEAVNAGIVFTVAAGNEFGDACRTSPAGAQKAITVGATTIQDMRAVFSNFGTCVDIFAPGMNIVSSWKGGAAMTMSGTSMASPHVAGLAAYFLSDKWVHPEEIKRQILTLATDGSLSLIPDDTPNLLAFNGYPLV
ncbi:hypothetical protein K501DRAFT_324413 [Backusella circina FSU 941]|nr:hypothetical protein K501DRAFT_324413 [Backusella circina FSU 941]